MIDVLSSGQTQTLRLLCDTLVPSIERADDADGFWHRTATDVGADLGVSGMLAGLPADQRQAIGGLLDVLAAQGFTPQAPQAVREQILTGLSQASPEAAAGIGSLTSLILLITYGITDPNGRNPNWTTLGYPGPVDMPADGRTVNPLKIDGDLDLDADVVVVGSGAGGGLIAGRLAAAGARVVVLEAGRYRADSDFHQRELDAYRDFYWRGGPTPTADANVTLMAGAGLGGGTVINWTNCLRTKDRVRREWATEHGLTDLAADTFDRHLDTVWRELSVTDKCSELNRVHEAMQRGATSLGWSFATIFRNWDAKRHDPAVAGYLGFGDRSGAKQSTLKVYLEPAIREHGARFVDGCRVDRVLVENGRAAGVTGTVTGENGTVTVTVRAPVVVVAAGALESPGVLLRSGIGGPATGDYLRLHPCTVTMGDYGTDLQAWWGAPQSGLVDEFAEDGFLIESVQYATGLGASALPFITPAGHKEAMAGYRNNGSFIGLIRDRGHGRVTLDSRGETVHHYALTDEHDIRTMQRAIESQIRLHHAAGARAIQLFARGIPAWTRGDDLEAYIGRARQVPLGAGGATLFSAHQMGSCRMGADPATSVADPRGELHDTPGVWIGDASAFPTPSGTNPMITIMALASRTAENISQL
ncbi:GMC family oxidoreductase N-terminal domain-containing protein [Actinoplanes couchii]|uniref:long-chain-alcohol oxidase n=1 Tax=Actinoplanes couchii TaxID=403638 RepID=A0ABQ3XGU0_9ACTN|nr:GMC family oxidoreductase N-terminal domain-containing protein [Actinoplanes couchii]MDR6320821.1 choline dehydrogenase-like flavoprotein [Actinoplanes couchii]GID57694.1 GMC oxidoreductase [Actinoplanes couchii]